MGIHYTIETDSPDYASEGWIPDRTIGYWPDVHLGRLILAQYVSDQVGANVYVVNGLYLGEDMPDSDAHKLMSVAFIKKNLMPWTSINLPLVLPDRYPGSIRVLARPVLTIIKDERMTSFDEE